MLTASIKINLKDWCHNPISLWDPKTTELIVYKEWKQLESQFLWEHDDYSSPGYILSQPKFNVQKSPLFPNDAEYQIYLEDPSQEISRFYSENELVFDKYNRNNNFNTKQKLIDALTLLNSIPELMKSIKLLVRVIGILKSEDSDCDVSYSHPELPFSIFVSLCSDRSPVSTARVAESILHEAMHLKLSLIQKSVELLTPEIQKAEVYFAPWRQENRPVNGVMHGIFVFRSILDFFRNQKETTKNEEMFMHSSKRIKEIEIELRKVNRFYDSPTLSDTGKELAQKLLSI